MRLFPRRLPGPVALSILLICLGAGCRRAESNLPPNPLNVLLITVDTCRFDCIGSSGRKGAALTPNIDRLAAKSVFFEKAYCQIPSTLPSHASILTGLTPLEHGVHDNGVYRLGDEYITLAERLKGYGYRTAAFVSAYVLDRRFGLSQGFDVYDDRMEDPVQTGPAPRFRKGTNPETMDMVKRFYGPSQRSADSVVPKAVEWLEEVEEDHFFLWLHLFDPHSPYSPPSHWIDRYDSGYTGQANGDATHFNAALNRGKVASRDLAHMIARYKGEVSYTDEWLGNLLAELDRLRLSRNTLVVLIGDHGEGFGEHGLYFEHNSLLYEETVRIPFLIHFPGEEERKRRISTAVNSIDLLPTLINALGEPAPDLVGRSLLPLIDGEEPAGTRCVYLEAICGRQAFPVPAERRGIVSGHWKFVRVTKRKDGTEELELYDLSKDPLERKNLASSRKKIVTELSRQLDGIIEAAKRGDGAGDHALDLDEEAMEKLRELGYIR